MMLNFDWKIGISYKYTKYYDIYYFTLLLKGPKALLQEEQYETSISLTQTGRGKRKVKRSSYVFIYKIRLRKKSYEYVEGKKQL